MNQVLSIAKKEIRAYFLSPVALIFLGLFLFVAFYAFFWVDTFFRRNIADIRPLFNWLPVLMVFLVAALTMRLWSDEQRSGTLEILLTLPVRTSRLVVGKFLAGLALIALALALTAGLPISVSMLGNLDWGPVFGGYFGALLMASSYLALGLCVSAATSNSIVALLVTTAGCGLLYLVGSDAVAGFGGNRIAELLRLVGTGSRFESIARGVVDIRDVIYYATLTGGFLFLNVVILDAKRWSQGDSTRPRRSAVKLSTVLVIANLLVINVALATVRNARIDLTERSEYSISPVTKKILRGLDAPLLIRGYFSEKTHPLLAPLVPRIRDLVEEYGAVGGKKVRAEFIDPQNNPALEKEANEDFNIKPVPFQFSDRHQAAVVNSYFHILIKYGDKYETLSFNDLIEIKVTGFRDVEVKLRNLEYDLTRSVKKAVYGFEPLETLFARMAEPVQLTAYITPDALPENIKDVPQHMAKVVDELKKRSNGKLTFKQINPAGPNNEALRRDIYRKYGLKPFATSLFGGDTFYCHLLITSGKHVERYIPGPKATEADVRRELTATLKRITPGFLKTVGLVVRKPEQPKQPNPMMQQQPQGPRYQLLKHQVGENYTVKNVELKDGRVPSTVDVLVLIGVDKLSEKERFAIDQFLMQGGSVVVCTGRYAMHPSMTGALEVQKQAFPLEDLLAAWGVTVEPKLVLDQQNQAFPVPVERNVMGLNVREIRLVKYPFWVDVRSDGMADGHPTVAGLPSVTMQWASPIDISKKKGIEFETLLRSTDSAWLQGNPQVQPDFRKYPGKGFGKPDSEPTKSYVLAVAAKGVFHSAFTGKANPLFEPAAGANAAANNTNRTKKADDEASPVIEKSPASARLIVIGSSDFIRDAVLGISRQTGSDVFNNNIQLMQNFIDWAVEDVELLKIRSRGSFARTLKPVEEEGTRTRWEFGNYAAVVLALGAILGLTFFRRRKLVPMNIAHRKDESAGSGGSDDNSGTSKGEQA